MASPFFFGEGPFSAGRRDRESARAFQEVLAERVTGEDIEPQPPGALVRGQNVLNALTLGLVPGRAAPSPFALDPSALTPDQQERFEALNEQQRAFAMLRNPEVFLRNADQPIEVLFPKTARQILGTGEGEVLQTETTPAGETTVTELRPRRPSNVDSVNVIFPDQTRRILNHNPRTGEFTDPDTGEQVRVGIGSSIFGFTGEATASDLGLTNKELESLRGAELSVASAGREIDRLVDFFSKGPEITASAGRFASVATAVSANLDAALDQLGKTVGFEVDGDDVTREEFLERVTTRNRRLLTSSTRGLRGDATLRARAESATIRLAFAVARIQNKTGRLTDQDFLFALRTIGVDQDPEVRSARLLDLKEELVSSFEDLVDQAARFTGQEIPVRDFRGEFGIDVQPAGSGGGSGGGGGAVDSMTVEELLTVDPAKLSPADRARLVERLGELE